MILYIYGVCTLLNIIICTQYTLYKHHYNPSTIASIYTIIPLPIKLITWHPGISLDGRIIRWLGHVILKPLLNQSEDRKLWRKRPLDYAFAAFKELLNSLKKTPYSSAFPYYIWAT